MVCDPTGKIGPSFSPHSPPSKFQAKLSVQPGLLPHWLISWHMETASPVPGRFSFSFYKNTIPSQLCSQVEAAVRDFHVETEKLPSNL